MVVTSIDFNNGLIVGAAVVNGLVTGNGKKYKIGDTIIPENLTLNTAGLGAAVWAKSKSTFGTVVSIKLDSLNNLFAVVYVDSAYHLYKMDTAGEVLWDIVLEDTPDVYGASIIDTIDDDGNIYVLGEALYLVSFDTYNVPIVVRNGQLIDFDYSETTFTYLCKVSASGEILWTIRQYDYTDITYAEGGHPKVKLTGFGIDSLRFIYVSYTIQSADTISAGAEIKYLVKYNEYGEEVSSLSGIYRASWLHVKNDSLYMYKYYADSGDLVGEKFRLNTAFEDLGLDTYCTLALVISLTLNGKNAYPRYVHSNGDIYYETWNTNIYNNNVAALCKTDNNGNNYVLVDNGDFSFGSAYYEEDLRVCVDADENVYIARVYQSGTTSISRVGSDQVQIWRSVTINFSDSRIIFVDQNKNVYINLYTSLGFPTLIKLDGNRHYTITG